ncbi:MFS transporter [Actinomadura sp. GTD37]|uniref:MFS transporter n=1 Tax=Actinomadura sp. GTD37 TaxID=1778030 RepID=UPI0035BEE9EA
MAVVGIAQLMVVLDATIVNIALPSAQADLGFSDADRQWIITAYALAFGSLLLLGGRIADLFGRKPTFLVGLAGFAVMSTAGGAAPTFAVLVAARAAQAVFGALLAPAALSLLTTTFDDSAERGRAFGIFGAISGGGGAIGLLLGGVLTEYLDWRWTLYVNMVLAAIPLLGGVLLLRRTPRDPGARLDVLGTVLASAGLFGLVYGFAGAESRGWGSVLTWGCLAGAAVLLAAFAGWQTRAARPLLPLRVLTDRNRAASYLAVLIVGAGMFGIFLFLTYYLQQGLGYSPVRTGLAFMPLVAATMVSASLSAAAPFVRIGPKPIVPVGMGIAVAGVVLLARLDLASTYPAHVLPALILLGVGFGLVIAPSISLGTAGIDPADSGVASATVNAAQQVGGSIGPAVLTTAAAQAVAGYVAGRDPADPAVRVHAAMKAYSTVYWWAAGLFAVGLAVTFLLFRPGAFPNSGDARP